MRKTVAFLLFLMLIMHSILSVCGAEGITVTANGLTGSFDVTVILDDNGAVSSITLGETSTDMDEPFLKLVKDSETFLAQFVGKTGEIEDADFDMVTGATSTSKAILRAVNGVLAAESGMWQCSACWRWVPVTKGCICPYCGAEQHDWSEADCEHAKTCKRCGITEGSPAGHQWDEGTVLIKATCTVPGIVKNVCTVCGAMQDNMIPRDPTNHTGETEKRNQREACCDADGYTGDTYCKDCGGLIGGGDTIPAPGHDWIEADCEHPKACAVCGATEGGLGEHRWDSGTVRVAATCMETGVVRYTCTVCGTTALQETPKDPANHVGETETRNTQEATCTADGYTGDNCCINCGGLISGGDTIPALGHDWIDADCTHPKTCARCGATEGGLGEHQWDSGTVRVAATCAETGIVSYSCKVCGVTELREIPKDPSNHAGETETRNASEAACTADGYTGDTYCLGCGSLIGSGEAIPALGHQWLEATREAPETCAVCGLTEGSPLPVIKTGDYIKFGHYPQTAEGNDSTPIEWMVLDVDEANNRALLLSRYGLDAKPYNKEYTDITWEKCTLRTWLNGEFLNKAFTAEEQKGIVRTTVDNSSSQGYSIWNTNGGNNTQDKIFLLSYVEVNKYLLVTKEDTNNKKPRVVPTEYAINQGAALGSITTTEGDKVGWWWLRSPGSHQSRATFVGNGGSLGGSPVSSDDAVVRPALWINLESGIF